jgi:HEAT repeat protein
MKSVVLATVFFPLIIPIWEKQPLNPENTACPEALTFLSEPEIRMQKVLFGKIRDSRIRSEMLDLFTRTNNPFSIPSLEEILYKEGNPDVTSDILKTIYNCRENTRLANPEKLEVFFNHKNTSARAVAAELYLINTENPEPVFELLKKEDSLFVKRKLWKALFEKARSPNLTVCAEFMKDPDETNRAGAVKIIALKADSPDTVKILTGAADDKSPLVRHALAKGLSHRKKEGKKLLLQLKKDPSSAVRAIVASVLRTENPENLIDLLNDPDWEVRRIVAETLGKSPDADTVNILIERLNDKFKPVRTAVENSIVKLKPDNEKIDKIIDSLQHKDKRNSAIRILGLLDIKKAAPAIAGILADSSSDETIRRAITALGRLNMKKSAELIARKSKNRPSAVRKAAAKALGVLNKTSTYDRLIELSKDEETEVSTEALEAMGRTRDSYFSGRLAKAARDISKTGKPENRAVACWAIAKIGTADKKTIDNLRKLFQKKILAMEGEKMYDADYVRASAVMAMATLGLKNTPEALEEAKKAVDYYYNDPFAIEGENSPVMEDFVRQIDAWLRGKNAKKEKLEYISPRKIVYRYPVPKKNEKMKKMKRTNLIENN